MLSIDTPSLYHVFSGGQGVFGAAPPSRGSRFAMSLRGVRSRWGHRYAPMAAGSSARAAREQDPGQRGCDSLLFAARCLSSLFTSPVNATPSGRFNPAATRSHHHAFPVEDRRAQFPGSAHHQLGLCQLCSYLKHDLAWSMFPGAMFEGFACAGERQHFGYHRL